MGKADSFYVYDLCAPDCLEVTVRPSRSVRLFGFLLLLGCDKDEATGPPSSRSITFPVQSTFDAGLDGWELTGDPSSTISWADQGGNPGGYLGFPNHGPGVGFVAAPSSFLGDWSSLQDTGVISFDVRIHDMGVESTLLLLEIRIGGPGGQAVYRATDTPSELARASWTAAANAFEWEIDAGTYPALLADVQFVHIRVDLTDGDGDVTCIDNVYLGQRR